VGVVYSPDVSYKEDLQKVHLKIDELAKRLDHPSTTGGVKHQYISVLVAAAITIVLSAICGYLVARWTVGQAREDAALADRIDNRVEAKLKPIGEGLAKLREDLAYVRAKVEDATARKVVGFSRLPANEIVGSLSDISKTISEARSKQAISPPEAVAELRAKLVQLQPRNPELWKALSNVVSYQSLIAEKMNVLPNAEQIRRKGCHFFGGTSGAPVTNWVEQGAASGCSQQLDIGVAWKDFTFENAIIIYRGGPVYLQNVRFKNCLFLVEFPGQPQPPARKFAEALLASRGPLLTFTVSTS
jgi:hypothetical protein